jgi:hypothetical protein
VGKKGSFRGQSWSTEASNYARAKNTRAPRCEFFGPGKATKLLCNRLGNVSGSGTDNGNEELPGA